MEERQDVAIYRGYVIVGKVYLPLRSEYIDACYEKRCIPFVLRRIARFSLSRKEARFNVSADNKRVSNKSR